MRVHLAFACPKRLIHDPSASLLPVGLLTIASHLQAEGHDVVVAHLARFGRRDALRLLLDGDPDVVGFSCFTFQRRRTLDWARALREETTGRRPLIVLGGPHASPLARETLERCPWVSAVVRGEGERTMATLLDRLGRDEALAGIPGLVVREGQAIVEGPDVEEVADLDVLPSPARANLTLLGVDRLYQMRHLLTARGCSSRCTFCYAPEAWGNEVRHLSVARVLDDLSVLRERYGLVYVSFRDDTFTARRDWIIELCRRLVESKSELLWDCQSRVTALDEETTAWLRRAGCIQIQLGVESGSDTVLERLGKPFRVSHIHSAVQACRKVGLPVSFYLICGAPEESTADIEATVRLVHSLRPWGASLSRLALYPGTELAREVPPELWFDSEEESLYLRNDKGVRAAEKRLGRLIEQQTGAEPFSTHELLAAGEALGWPAPAGWALAQLYERQAQFDEAEQVYRDVLSRYSHYPWAELGLGDLLLDEGDYGEALAHLQRVVDDVPGWPYPLSRLGWALVGVGREEEGRAFIAQALALEPFAEPSPPPAGF